MRWYGLSMAPVNHAALRALRLKDGYTGASFARACGMDRSHLANIESGRNGCSPALIREMARVLGVPISAIAAPPPAKADDEAVA